MARFVIGIILTSIAIMGLMGAIGSYSQGETSPNEFLGGMIFLGILTISGIFLIFNGRHFITHRRKVLEYALTMLRESNEINMDKLIERFSISEIQIKNFLTYGRTKGILPRFEKAITKTQVNEILTIEDILKMLETGLSDDVIIEKIRSSGVISFVLFQTLSRKISESFV